MTLSELKNEIMALGFNGDVDSADLLIFSINRALRDIYLRRSILTTVRLFSVGQIPSTYIKEMECTNNNPITLPLEGRAYSMRLCGKGQYRIDNRDGTFTVSPFETGRESMLVKGFINNGKSIKFYGTTAFIIYDFSLFDTVYTVVPSNLPEGKCDVSFDLRAMYGDFLSFVSPPRNADGKIIENCKLYDGKLELPVGYRGEINLTYRRLPKPVVNDNDHVIDIPDEYSQALALLSSFYIWLDLDETKAVCYRDEYERIISLFEKESYQQLDSAYINVNGWA